MAPVYSQNGYPANDESLVSSRLIPGTTRRLRLRNGPAGDLLLAFAGEFDRLVENIDAPQEVMDDWGYAERPIRGGTELSNHASGTAEDLNATKHPLGTAPSASFHPVQIAAIHKLLARAQGCIRWGGDYVGRKDPMHFEIVKGEAACRAALANFRNAPPQEDDDMQPDTKFRSQDYAKKPGTVGFAFEHERQQLAAIRSMVDTLEPGQRALAAAVAAQVIAAQRAMLVEAVADIVPEEQVDAILDRLGERLQADAAPAQA